MTEQSHGRPTRRLFLPWRQVLADPADTGLVDDLHELLPAETTDDMDDPWQKVAADLDNSDTLDP
jgi:hypothetical protein